MDCVVELDPAGILRPNRGELRMPGRERPDRRRDFRLALGRLQVAVTLDTEAILRPREIHPSAMVAVTRRTGRRRRLIRGVRAGGSTGRGKFSGTRRTSFSECVMASGFCRMYPTSESCTNARTFSGVSCGASSAIRSSKNNG